MKDEEMAEEKYCKGCKWRIEQCLWAWRKVNGLNEPNEKNCSCKEVPAFLAGLKAGRPQWHKVTDWKDNSRFPKDELKTYLVCLYQDHYVICELNITEGYRQFYLPDNLEYIDPQDVVRWCEIPTFDKE